MSSMDRGTLTPTTSVGAIYVVRHKGSGTRRTAYATLSVSERNDERNTLRTLRGLLSKNSPGSRRSDSFLSDTSYSKVACDAVIESILERLSFITETRKRRSSR